MCLSLVLELVVHCELCFSDPPSPWGSATIYQQMEMIHLWSVMSRARRHRKCRNSCQLPILNWHKSLCSLLWPHGGCFITSYQPVQSLSCVWLFVIPLTAARKASLSITISWRLLKLMSIESVVRSNHLILCRPLLLLPSDFPSIRVFSNESVLYIRWPKYWSFSFSISPSSEYSGLLCFRMDWLDLLVDQGTLKNLL